MSPWSPYWPGFEAQSLRGFRLPRGVSGFYYEDGNRLQFDSLTGSLTRHVEGYGDTTIHVNLGKDQEARLFEKIVASGFFAFATAEQEDAPYDSRGSCDLVQFCAASDSTQRCDWWTRSEEMSSVPSRVKFNQVLEEIRAMLLATPEYRALPPLPKGL